MPWKNLRISRRITCDTLHNTYSGLKLSPLYLCVDILDEIDLTGIDEDICYERDQQKRTVYRTENVYGMIREVWEHDHQHQ